MRASTWAFMGIGLTMVAFLLIYYYLPADTHMGIPINHDVTVRMSESKLSPPKKEGKKKGVLESKKDFTDIKSSPDIQKKDLHGDSKIKTKSSTDDTFEVDKLYSRIADLEKLLDGVVNTSNSLKNLVSSHTKRKTYTTSCNCVPLSQIKIEEITPYLRSPRWFKDKNPAYAEDRSYLDFLANHYTPPKSTRKILLDLGASTFESSVLWFRDNYPLHFDEIHAFEPTKKFVIPSRAQIGNDFYNSIKFYEKRVDTYTDDARGVLNFAKWMKEVLKPSECDFVVLKMDIEDKEWDVLPDLEAKGLHRFVDELFVEIHYYEPDLEGFGWKGFTKSKDEAIKLLRHWRDDLGVYAHYWP